MRWVPTERCRLEDQMNIFRVLAVSRKETKQIIRDSRSLYLALGIPIMLMILFGYAVVSGRG